MLWVLETPNDGCEEVWKREIELVSVFVNGNVDWWKGERRADISFSSCFPQLHELEVLEDSSLIPESESLTFISLPFRRLYATNHSPSSLGLITPVQARWRKECSALKATFASKSKSKKARAPVKTKAKKAIDTDEEEEEHNHGNEEEEVVEEKPVKVAKKPRATTKKKDGKLKGGKVKEEESYGED